MVHRYQLETSVRKACMLGKHRRGKFAREGAWKTSSQSWYTMNHDLCGPLRMSSWEGVEYFIKKLMMIS